MLIVEYPENCIEEREYTFKVLLDEILGIPYRTRVSQRKDILIQHQGKSIRMEDSFFPMAFENWLDERTLPRLPLENWDAESIGLKINLIHPRVPVVYGQANIAFDRKNTWIGIDIPGTIFFILSCYEAGVISHGDAHGRFPASSSIAFKAGYLHRPLVNEYVEILWSIMVAMWPGLERKRLEFRMAVSCDVDQAYASYIKSMSLTLKKMVGDLYRRKSIKMAVQSFLNTFYSRYHRFQFDPNHTFDQIMDLNEVAGNRVMFNFLADSSVPEMDGNYSIFEQRIRWLMRRIHERGHEIGLHGSYGAYDSLGRCYREAGRLRQVMEEENIHQPVLGHRQHYLRWDILKSAKNLECAGLWYDTTLGYADQPGFRCGTTLDYLMYDLDHRRPLKIYQRPLILMECSVVEAPYLDMGYGENALDLMLTIKETVKRFGGYFTLLWHNSNLENHVALEMYKTLLMN